MFTVVSQFTIGFGRTVNLGNFESARVDASITVDVPRDGKCGLEEAMKEAQTALRKLLEETYRCQYADRNSKSRNP